MSFLTYNELKSLLVPVAQQQMTEQNRKNKKVQYMLDISHKQLRKLPLQIPSSQFIITDIEASYNYFKDLYHLNNQPNPNLMYINFSFNFLTRNNFTSLKILDLNANRIEYVEIKNEEFPQLQALYLKNNKIKYFLRCPSKLNILCLDHNQLQKLGFTGGQSLQILSASYLQHFQNINFIDLEDNMISDMIHFESILVKAQNLLSLNMIGNYVSKIGHKKFLISVLSLCPKIVKIDEIIINPHVREAFKTLKQEQNLQRMLEETHEAYQQRMKQQLALKEEMLDKINAEKQKIQGNFKQYLKNQKKHVQALQQYAKSNMGVRKLKIAQQNKEMKPIVKQYLGEKYENQKRQEQQKMNVIQTHQKQYQQFNTNHNQNVQKISSNIQNKEYNEQLNQHEKQRRRRNMKNPTLIYRNSNHLILDEYQLLKQKTTSSKRNAKDQPSVLNQKCLPYLMKLYGFHTIT